MSKFPESKASKYTLSFRNNLRADSKISNKSKEKANINNTRRNTSPQNYTKNKNYSARKFGDNTKKKNFEELDCEKMDKEKDNIIGLKTEMIGLKDNLVKTENSINGLKTEMIGLKEEMGKLAKKFEGLGTVIASAVEKGINSSFQKLNFPDVSLNYTKTEQNENIEIPILDDEETKKNKNKTFSSNNAKEEEIFPIVYASENENKSKQSDSIKSNLNSESSKESVNEKKKTKIIFRKEKISIGKEPIKVINKIDEGDNRITSIRRQYMNQKESK